MLAVEARGDVTVKFPKVWVSNRIDRDFGWDLASGLSVWLLAVKLTAVKTFIFGLFSGGRIDSACLTKVSSLCFMDLISSSGFWGRGGKGCLFGERKEASL